MKRNILSEVNRMREIMGLNLILEQSESLFTAEDVMPDSSNTTIVVRQYKSKLTEESKSYWDASTEGSEGGDKCSPASYFRYRMPLAWVSQEAINKYNQGVAYGEEDDTGKWFIYDEGTRGFGVVGEYLYFDFGKRSGSERALSWKIFNIDMVKKGKDKKEQNIYRFYPYSDNREIKFESKPGETKIIMPGASDSYDTYEIFKNPGYNSESFRMCDAIKNTKDKEGKTISSIRTGIDVKLLDVETRIKFVTEFVDWCVASFPDESSEYGYDWSKCSDAITKITIKPGKLSIDSEEGGEETEPVNAVRYEGIINSENEGEPFKNNSTEISQGLIKWVSETKEYLREALSSQPNMTFSVVENADGQNYPFTIATSASRYKNTQQAANMNFKELSEARAKSAYDYIVSELSELIPNIGSVKVVLNSDGINGDGSSGPNPPSPNSFSTGGGEPNSYKKDGDRKFNGMDPHTSPNEYEKYKFCKIKIALVGIIEDDTIPSTPTTPPDVISVGEWSQKISRKYKKRRQRKTYTFDWKPGGGGSGGGGRVKERPNWMPCVAYD